MVLRRLDSDASSGFVGIEDKELIGSCFIDCSTSNRGVAHQAIDPFGLRVGNGCIVMLSCVLDDCVVSP